MKNLDTKVLISVKKLNGLVIDNKNTKATNMAHAMTVQANVMGLGYILSQDLVNAIASLSVPQIEKVANKLVAVLRNLKGADVVYRPMYPNFPQQVIEASDMELFTNAILHYWTWGQWLPEYDELQREFAFESGKMVTLDLVSEQEFGNVFTRILSSNDSVSDEDKTYLEWFMDNYAILVYPAVIPYKENMCYVAGHMLANGKDIAPMIKTATDVLRVATYLSDGDVSLAENTRYRSQPRPVRRVLVQLLEDVIREEDIARHSQKWVRLAHSLHVGDYSQKVYDIIRKVRENVTIETFNSKVEAAIADKNLLEAVSLLKQRPGEFARRLDELLRIKYVRIEDRNAVIDEFLKVAGEVPSRTLLQVLGHFQRRDKKLAERVVFPKGNVQQGRVIGGLAPLNSRLVSTVTDGVRSVLEMKFSGMEDLGNVYVDPVLASSPVPTQQRSASTGLFSVARGTRMPIDGDKNTLRFFIYWKGRDIDLSATLHDENFKNIGHVSYTQLRNSKYQAYHSGDITSAYNGACEFIDITMDGARNAGARYVAMNVLVFSGPNFSDHEVCYAGWMTRSQPNSNEIFEPKTVEQKIDVRSETRNVIPVIFDLETREAIWFDMSTGMSRYGYWGNNVESNRATIEQTVKAVVSNDNKVNLFDLFSMHGRARGQLVDTPEEADTVFSLRDGITPFNVDIIQSEYIAD